jgi:ATP-binding cassette, subfamily B, bacterial PglK
MNVARTIKSTFIFLNKYNKRYMFKSIIVLGILGILDIVGLAFLGLTGLSVSNPGRIFNFNFLNFSLKFESNATLNYKLVVFTVAIFTLKGVLSPLVYHRILRKLSQIASDTSVTLTRQFLNQNIDFVKSRNSQESLHALNYGVTSSISDVIGSSILAVSEIILLIFIFLFLIIIQTQLAFTLLLYFMLILFGIHFVLGKKQRQNSKLRFDSIVESNQILTEIISVFREVRISGKFDFFIAKYKKTRDKEAVSSTTALVLNLVPKYIFEIGFYVGSLIMAILLFSIGLQDDALAIFLMFIAAGSRILPALLRLQSALGTVITHSSLSQRSVTLKNEIDEQTQRKVVPEYLEVESHKHIFQIRNLDFSYSQNQNWRLNIPSLLINEGSFTAIVGPSGSGKSTLVDLLLGVSQPNSGSILRSQNFYQARIGFVPQEIGFLSGSIFENIALGIPEDKVDVDRILSILDLVGLKSLLDETTGRLNRDLRENGNNLSGGQKQKIGIARALYQNPEILVIDEGTSALDAKSESDLTAILHNLKQRATLIVVAHRLSSIKNADVVVYMEDGMVVCQGSFDEVREFSPKFNQQAILLGL